MKSTSLEGRDVWILNVFWDKVVYVCGWIFVVLFSIGVLQGLFN